MKTNSKTKLLEELKKVPIIQVACEKSGISRQTYYRWRKESDKFLNQVNKAMQEGIAFVNDMSETQLLNLIKEKDFKAVSFWLRNRHQDYKSKIEVTNKDEVVVLDKEQKRIIKNALTLIDINYENN